MKLKVLEPQVSCARAIPTPACLEAAFVGPVGTAHSPPAPPGIPPGSRCLLLLAGARVLLVRRLPPSAHGWSTGFDTQKKLRRHFQAMNSIGKISLSTASRFRNRLQHHVTALNAPKLRPATSANSWKNQVQMRKL